MDDEAWKQVPAWQDPFHDTEKQGVVSSQTTEVRLGYDDHFIYVAMTCWEKEKKGFQTAGGAQMTPWFDDSIEFSLTPPSWSDRFVHYIVNADAVTYQETYVHSTEKHETSNMPIRFAAKQYADRFTVEAAVPLGEGGLPAPKPGEQWKGQFMRTRVAPSSAREYTTWAPAEGYNDFSSFGAVLFD